MSAHTQELKEGSDAQQDMMTEAMEAVGNDFINAVKELVEKSEQMDSAIDEARKGLAELSHVLSATQQQTDRPVVNSLQSLPNHTATGNFALWFILLLVTLLIVFNLKRVALRDAHRR